jgi:hypothetical protein
MPLDPTLLDLAAYRLKADAEREAFLTKRAFVPSGSTDPAAAAAGMGDPAAAMGGGGGMGMPPGGGMGMPMPMDPAMAGTMPGAMAAAQPPMPGQPAPGQPGQPAAGAGKSNKIDPAFIYQELARIRKLQTHMYQQMGWQLPPDILDDATAAQALIGGAPPVSQPIQPGPAGPPPGGAAPGGAPQGDPAAAMAPGPEAGAPKAAALADDLTASLDTLALLLAGD